MKIQGPHQYAGQQWLRANPRGMCCSGMRTGKTLTGVYSVLNEGPGIVVCPSSAKMVWRNEFLGVDPSLVIDVVQGRSHGFLSNPDIVICNYDVLGDNFDRLPARARGNWILADEAHKAKNPEATRTGAVMALLRYSRIAHPFSGTPMPSRPIEWWPILNALGITELDWTAFAYRYAGAYNSKYGFNARGASNLDELRALIAPHMFRVTKEQLNAQYIPPEYRLITFDRPADERESQFTVEQLMQFDNPVLSLEGLAEVLKSSALRKIPDAAEFIESLLDEEQKIVVFGWHKEVIAGLMEALKGHKSVKIDGSSTPKQRELAKQQFTNDPDTRLIFGNLLSMGEAIDLSVADTTVFMETGWVPAWIQQAAERTQSMYKLNTQAVSYLLTLERSIDHFQLTRVLEKLAVINRILG